MKTKLALLLQSAAIAVGIAACALLPEIAFINYLADAQGGIAIFVSLFAAILTTLICFPIAYWAAVARGGGRKVGIALLLTIFGFILYSDFGLLRSYQALETARNPSTPAETLISLANGHYDNIRYTLDNDLANHPNCNEELTRLLAKRIDQTGTLAILARNPKTPLDVLKEISKVEDAFVQEALAENEVWKKQPH